VLLGFLVDYPKGILFLLEKSVNTNDFILIPKPVFAFEIIKKIVCSAPLFGEPVRNTIWMCSLLAKLFSQNTSELIP